MASTARRGTSLLTSVASTGRNPITTPRKTAFSTTSKASAAAPFTTAPRQAALTTQHRPCIAARTPPKPSALAIARPASTSTTSDQRPIPDHVLTWDRFFELRRKRRYINLGASAITAIGTVGVFGPVIAQQDLDGWAAQVSGLDPFVVLGLTTFAVAAGGWLCGPSIGNLGFKTWAGRKGWSQGMVEKEKSFYDRIKRYRGDPSHSSMQNPIPDFYGEKIGSVKDYRRWLKDQRAFNLKKKRAFV